MKQMTLSGDFREIGRQYGSACRGSIKVFTKAIQVMRALSERPGATFFDPRYRNLPLVLPRFLANRKRYRAEAREYRGILETHYPESIDMLEGMAEGARVALDDLLFLNAASEASLHCTVIATTGSESAAGTPLLAMNADEAKGTERLEAVFDFRPDSGYRYVVTAMKGVLYFNFGMNERGLSMAGTFLFLDVDEDARSQVPMLVYFSILNRCATVDEAIEAVRSLPRADVGLVLYLADAAKFVRVEQSAMDRTIDVVGDGLRWNANFPNSPVMARFSTLDEMDDATSLFARNRIKRLTHFGDRFHGAFDAEAMHAVLSDHGDTADETNRRSMCMHPEHAAGKQTCASMIADPARRVVRFYTANPCNGDFVEYRLDAESSPASVAGSALTSDPGADVGSE
jgi:predicted choloylglycine hydrolase